MGGKGEKMTLEKIQAIRDYLLQHFPSAGHFDEEDFERKSHKFMIGIKDQILIIAFDRVCIEHNETEILRKALEEQKVTDLLKSNPKSIVSVKCCGNGGQRIGCKVEPRN